MAKALICELCDRVFKEYSLRKEISFQKTDGQERYLVLDVIYQCQHRDRRGHKPDICRNCIIDFLGDIVAEHNPQGGPIWEKEGDECSNQSVAQASLPVTGT